MRLRNLHPVFYPSSIAVVGATNTPGTVPNDIFMNIMRSGFPGPIYPVSPGHATISGAKAYKYVIDIPYPVDLAVIVFPSTVAPLALEQCGQKGIKAAIVISAGFKEIGGKGRELEEKMKEIAGKYDISMIGPNCLGVINTDPAIQLNASFARKMPVEGAIGFLSQSGALCTAVLDYALNKHIGFSKFVSFGNKADINEVDLLRYLLDDEKTRTILLYLEEISLGREWMELLRENPTTKPILALKAGRTEEGGAAARSHTGSLAGSDEVCDAAFRQLGVIRARNIEEMFNHAILLTHQPLPKGNRIAIVTNAGGPGVMAADASIENGLQLARFSPGTTEILKKSLPRTANIANPVDVIGDARADRYDAALSSIWKDEDVDGVLCILTPQSMTDIESVAALLCRIEKDMTKPLLASMMGGSDVLPAIEMLQKRHIPHYPLPEAACQSFATAVRFGRWLSRPRGNVRTFEVDRKGARKVIEEHARGGGYLSEPQALELLSCYGFPVLGHQVAATAGEAVEAAEKIGYPVVLKVVSQDVIHKSDVGGVLVGPASAEEVRKGFERILENVRSQQPEASVRGVMVEEKAPHGREVILGVKRDASFGPVVMFGAGGVYVEFIKDISFRVAPMTELDIHEMLTETRTYTLLSGIRGEKPADIESVVECVERLSQLAVDFPEIAELDINPLFVGEKGKGCRIVDARIMVGS